MPAISEPTQSTDRGELGQFFDATPPTPTPAVDSPLKQFFEEPSTEDFATKSGGGSPLSQFFEPTPTHEAEKALADTPKVPPQVQDIFDQSIEQQKIEATAKPPAAVDKIVAPIADRLPATGPAPQWIQNAVTAAVETGVDFIPKTTNEVVNFLTPAAGAVEEVKKTYGLVRDMVAGKTLEESERANFPESFALVDADKTPPFSKERFKAGFGVLAQMGMLAAGGRGLVKEAGAPTETSTSLDTKPVVSTEPQSLETKLPVASEAPPEPGTPAADVSRAGRLAADMGLGLKAAQVPGFDTMAGPWVDAVKSFVPLFKGAKRFAEIGGQRDEVAAKFDAANNMAGMVARQARNHVRLAGDHDLKQQAATFVRQANGDKAGMIAKLNGIRGKGYDNVIDYAIRNWDSLEPITEAAKRGTDAAHAEAEAAGVNVDYRDNYVKGAYQDPVTQKVVIDEAGGGRGAGTSFKKSKVFNDYAEAIAAGFKPKDLRLDNLTESAVNSTLRVVNRKKWQDSLGSVAMPDGKMVTTDFLTDPNKVGQRIVPRGYKAVKIGTDVVPVHEDIAPTVQALSSDSMIPKLLTHGAAFLKHNILVFDIFHGSRFGQMQAAFERKMPSYHKGLSLLEFADADLSKAVAGNLITPKEAAWASANRPKLEELVKSGLNVGRISDALYADAVPLLPGAKQTNKFIFEKLSRGIITQSAMTALERNARLHPDFSPEQLHRFTAKEVNTYYRNLGSQGVFKSKTFQDLARTLVFAPQWIEGLVRSEARGYGQFAKLATTGKLGNIGAGMGTGLVAYFALSQVVNMVTRGKPTWENDEPGHKFDAWIPDFIQGSNGFFISPLSVFAETTHDALKYTERGMEPLDVTSQLISNKLHPQVRAMRDLLGGKDFFGRPLYGWERVTQAARDIAPVPMFARTGGYKGGAQRQLMATAGIKATVAPTSTNDIYQLAKNYRMEHGLATAEDKGLVHEESDYAKLRRSLHDGDMEQARVEYDELLKTKKASKISDYFERYPRKAFSGNATRERAFKRSLDRGQMDIYNAALRERQEVSRLFRQVRSR